MLKRFMGVFLCFGLAALCVGCSGTIPIDAPTQQSGDATTENATLDNSEPAATTDETASETGNADENNVDEEYELKRAGVGVTGKVIGIVGVDFSAEWYDTQVTEHIRMVVILSIVMLIVGILAVLFLTAKVKKRFNVLNDKLSDIADGSGDLTKKIVTHILSIFSIYRSALVNVCVLLFSVCSPAVYNAAF